MKRATVNFVEVVHDADIKRKERRINRAVRRRFPNCGSVQLYRTRDGHVGVQMQVRVAVGKRKQIDDIYRFIMATLGSKRGRPRGAETVQTKLNLPKPLYMALKRRALQSRGSMSAIVADSLASHLQA